ncbi:SAICAR synthase-like protein [Lactarius pseudohatsudake]|nr:SAICAR synthase-like protein [Lactarius pseudohatsudake]
MADRSVASIHPLTSQVGGHKGIQTSHDGALLFKPALPHELQFYQNSLADPALASLRQWIPTYLGTLRLEGQMTADGLANVEGIPEGKKDLLVIENAAHGFLKPNILDIKLGTVLYEEDAPPEKKERMQNIARCTTSGDTGVRLTGFQVFGNTTSLPVIFPKNYGKTIRVSELGAGVARFFPISGSMIGLPGAEAGGRMDVGLPRTLLLPVLKSIRKSVQEIRDAMSVIEMRMVAGSLLIVYEGDWDRAEMGVQWLAEQATSDGGGRESEGAMEEDSEEDSDSGDESDDELSGGSKPPCVVKVIDFAHVRFKAGEGPDRGVLKGLDTVLSLLDGRITDCMTS